MPKQALVLNGFGGGINKDSDATDLPTNGRGKDQAVTITNLLTDYGGRLYRALYLFEENLTVASEDLTSGASDLLIYNDKAYQKTGLYKIGSDVNWSGNITAVTPTSIGFSGHSNPNSVGLQLAGATLASETIFTGTGASSGASSVVQVGGEERSEPFEIHKYLRVGHDADNDNKFFEANPDYWNHLPFAGRYSRVVDEEDYTSSAGNTTIYSDGGGLVNDIGENGIKILDGCEHDPDGDDEYLWIDTTVGKGWDVGYGCKVYIKISGLSAGDRIPLQFGTARIEMLTPTTYDMYAFVIDFDAGDGDGVYSFTVDHFTDAQTDDLSDYIFLTVGEGEAATVGDSVYIEAITALTVSSSYAAFIDDSDNQIDTFHGGTDEGDPDTTELPKGDLNGSNEAEAYDISAAKALRFYKYSDDSENFSISFRVGNKDVKEDDSEDGLFGDIYNVEDRDIYLDIAVDPTSVLTGEGDIQEIRLWLDSNPDADDFNMYLGSDSFAVEYVLSYNELVAQNVWQQQGRIKIPYSSYTRLGANFDPKGVKNIGLMIDCDQDGSYDWDTPPVAANPGGTPVLDLFEISLADAGDLGWSHSKVDIFQSDTRNNSESLPGKYSSSFAFSTNNMLNLDIYKPAPGYSGNVYYQLVDSEDESITGSRFVLCYVDYTKGVKRIGEYDYTAWTDTEDISAYSLEFADGNTTVTHAGTETPAVGQFVTGTNIPAGAMVASITNSAEFELSLAATGDDDGNYAFTTSKVSFSYKSTPMQSTYELESGYPENTEIVDATWTTAATNGRQVYIGNVTQDGVTDTDKILKAPIGKLYGFSNKNYIDLELGAGNINVLESAGDRLFVFSDDNLTIVNIAQDYEYLEATLPGYGVSNSYQVAKVMEGIAFVNASGVYYFDGSKIRNLSDNALDTISWGSSSKLSYNTSTKSLICWRAGGDTENYIYSFKTESWVGFVNSLSDTSDGPDTNTVSYQDTIFMVDTGDRLSQLNTLSSGTQDIELKTGRISCGNLAMQKSFKKVHITLINPSAALSVNFAIDGGTMSTETGNLSTTGSGKYTVNIPASYKKGKDLQIQITDSDAPYDFEISDIQLIYRDKKIK